MLHKIKISRQGAMAQWKRYNFIAPLRALRETKVAGYRRNRETII